MGTMTREPSPIASLGRTSFVCPFCGALAQQQWAELYPAYRSIDNPVEIPLDQNEIEELIRSTRDPSEKSELLKIGRTILADYPADFNIDHASVYRKFGNLHSSKCFSCEKTALWLRDRLIYPTMAYKVRPNPDLPDEVLIEFNEAALILPLSPRGAAALLRLAIQRLCNFLDKTGDIDKMIGDLVSDGLSPRVQKALDIVRVIGNESVHPGTIDVRDTPEIAEQLFSLVNIIAEKMISEPRHIDELYGKLPEAKRARIDKRNEKAQGNTGKT